MSVQATSWVIKHSPHKGSELLCLIMIADHASPDGTNAYPSIKTLAAECRMSERQVTRIVQRLEASGAISVDRSSGRVSHMYTVNMSGLETVNIDTLSVSNVDKVSGSRRKSTLTNPSPNPDKLDANPDIAMSPKPRNRKEPSFEGIPTSSPRAVPVNKTRDRPVYNAIVRKWRPGKTWRDLTPSEQSLVGKITTELESVGATEEQVEAAWDIWPRAMRGMRSECSPPLLSQFWGDLQKAATKSTNGFDPNRHELVEIGGVRGYRDR